MKKREKKPQKMRSLGYPLPSEDQIVQLYSKFKNESSENNGVVSSDNNDTASDTSSSEVQPPNQ